MKRQKYKLYIAICLFVTGVLCMLVGIHQIKQSRMQQIPDGFVVEKMLRHTPIKHQGQLPTCWIYAMLATIETEHIMQGDSVNLSADYLGRMMRLHEGHDVNMRGVIPMTIQLIGKYGLVPYDSYKDAGMDKDTGYLPKKVFMLRAEYTPMEFGHSVCMPDEYQTIMSSTKKEYYKMQHTGLKDDRYDCMALNIPKDSLSSIVNRALDTNHPVCWEGGPEDNHAVSIIGKGHDRNGTKYFVAKNSWGTDNPTHGMMYISEDYLRNYTTLLVVSKSVDTNLLNHCH